jgi:GntR family transcriptional regulator, transcriptional repressor for pyruvate dehydrogenase complex
MINILISYNHNLLRRGIKMKFQNEPIYKKLIDHLLERIKGGIYEEGSRFPTEYELSKEFEVSRNCVREAVKCLSAGGLVISKAGKGSILAANAKKMLINSNGMVLDFGNYNSLFDLLQLRLIIEPEAAAIAAVKANSKQLKELQDVLENFNDRFKRKKNWVEQAFNAHNLIVEMTGNRYLIKVMNFISEELKKSRSYLFNKNNLYAQASEEHHNIFLSISNNDAEKAKYYMRVHLEHAREIYLD